METSGNDEVDACGLLPDWFLPASTSSGENNMNHELHALY